MENILYLDHPWISVYTNVVDNETCDKFVKKYTDIGMNPNAGLESREQTYGQITEEVEQRSISWDTSTEDRQFFRNKICEVLKIPDSHIEAGDFIDTIQVNTLVCITTFHTHQKTLLITQKEVIEKQLQYFG